MLVGNMALPLMKETVWFDKHRFDDAERVYEERRAGQIQTGSGDAKALNNSPALGSTIAEEIAKTRQRIQNSLKNVSLKTDSEEATSINQRVQHLESVMDKLSNQVTELFSFVQNVTGQLQTVQQFLQSQGMQAQALSLKTPPPAAAQPKAANKADDDDDIDLFGSEDDEEMNAHRAARLKEYETKKAKKGPLVAKSSVVLDVKPWDDETDLKLMEAKVREIKPDGLVWGASKSVPLAFGIHKLQIVAIVEDEKVSIDWLQETIQEIEDLVQSVDIAAFNKL